MTAQVFERVIVINNELGLHARAAAKFVNIAIKFKSEINLQSGDIEVNGKSIMGILMLAIPFGSKIRIVANGTDAEEAVNALAKLVVCKFGEDV
jgi:phosphocarrier protein